MRSKISLKSFALIIAIGLCCLASIVVTIGTTDSIYKSIWSLPIAYLLCFVFLLFPVVQKQYSIFTVTLIIMSFVRYVLLPMGMVLANKYTGKSPSDPSASSVTIAVVLMIYELFALALFLRYLCSRSVYTNPPKRYQQDEEASSIYEGITYGAGYLVYGSFFALTAGLVISHPHTIVNFNFIVPTSSTIKNMVNIGTVEQIATVCLSVSKQFVALFIAFGCYRKHQKAHSAIWSIIALVAMLLNACIYTGTNRSDFILMVIASFLLYATLFPENRRGTTIIMVVLLAIAVPALSTYRKAGIVDISNGAQGFINSVTDIMWGYSGGPYNVAIAYEAAHMYPEGRNILNLFYDFLRPTFGLNLLMQRIPLTYSNVYFNYRYYMTTRVTQILPMVGEGYFYFGVIGSPLITMLFGWLGLKLSHIRKWTRDPFVVYFLTITCCRLGFIMGQNATIQMNDLSFNLFVPLLLIYFSRKIRIR